MMKIVSFVGWSGAGKSTLLEKIIRQLIAQKYRVTVIKHAPHAYHLQPEGKDTYMFREAGAEAVWLVSKSELIKMESRPEERDLKSYIIHGNPGADFIFLEGLVLDRVPLIEVFDHTISTTLKYPLEKLSAIVSDPIVSEVIPNFSKINIEPLLGYIKELS
jgi:molybdopterin-guanine dinucleotide biosynthesis protein B